MSARAMGVREWLMLIGLSVLWGGSFFFNALAVADLSPVSVVFARVAIAAAALWLVIAVCGRYRPPGPSLWPAFVVMGLLNNVIPFTLIVWGQTRIGSGLASILNATTPLASVVLAHWLLGDERITPARLAGVLAGLAGVAVMIGPDALASLGFDVLAELAVLAAAISYAFAGIFGRRFRATPPLVTAAGQLSASAILLLPMVVVTGRPWNFAAVTSTTWGAVLGLALASTALAYVIYFRILATAGPTNLLLVTFLIPVSAVVLGTGVLGEILEPRQIAGMCLIGLGLAAIDGRPWAACRRALAGARRRPLAPSRCEDRLL